jgi:hypothetical protein
MKKRWIVLSVLLLASAGALVLAVERANIAPRRLAAYVEQRAEGHNPQIIDTGRTVAKWLNGVDRGALAAAALPNWKLGAREDAQLPAPAGNAVTVASKAEALRAIGNARSGDVITFAPGSYLFDKMSYIETSKASGVTVRAARLATVTLEFAMKEGFLVMSPRWTFENLAIRGVCKQHSQCEHAFHVSGNASGFTLRNSTTTDFNAHLKINSLRGMHPDDGRIEHNTMRNTSVRDTDKPVTVIDLVGGSGWTIKGNLIADFVKSKGDGISYGAFAKGAGEHNRFEGNAVLCEQQLRGTTGARVGLSLGGGGTGVPYCRDQRCDTEQKDSAIVANLVMSCSDEGIYLNRAAGSKVLHNTLIDTAGIMARHKESGATLEGNIIDGRIAVGQDAQIDGTDNLVTGVSRLYLGSHPQRALFLAPAGLNLRWSGEPPRRVASGVPDLCGAARPARPTYGAFEDFSACEN